MISQIIIKNIVCSRCIRIVREIFEQHEAQVVDVQLGFVEIEGALTTAQKEAIKKDLAKDDFEWVEDSKEKLVALIKAIIIEQIHYEKEALKVNFSDFLIKKVNYSYAHMSRVFAALEHQTIGAFIMAQKIERVKELLLYDELSLSEIASLLHYSSVGQLSNQFKKVVGCSPTEYKKNDGSRNSLDKL